MKNHYHNNFDFRSLNQLNDALQQTGHVPPEDLHLELCVELKCMADIEIRPINWLWPDRIACGKLTILAGDPGLGKSQIAAYVAARVTTGGQWLENEGYAPLGDVIILSAEDDVADTIKPRLLAAGADINHCYVLEAVKIEKKGKKTVRAFNLAEDIEKLEQILGHKSNVRLVIIDPISAYLGKIDSHNNADLRAILTPLAQVAAKHNTAILAITHFNKSNANEPLSRVIGSIGLVAAARAAYVIVKDPKDPAIRYFLPIKNNIGNDSQGFAYSIVTFFLDDSITTSQVSWRSGTVDAKAILNTSEEPRASSVTEACELLKELLKNGPLAASEIMGQAEAVGFSKAAMQRAKQRLKVKHRKLGMKEGWEWFLPNEDVEHSEDFRFQKD